MTWPNLIQVKTDLLLLKSISDEQERPPAPVITEPKSATAPIVATRGWEAHRARRHICAGN